MHSPWILPKEAIGILLQGGSTSPTTVQLNNLVAKQAYKPVRSSKFGEYSAIVLGSEGGFDKK